MTEQEAARLAAIRARLAELDAAEARLRELATVPPGDWRPAYDAVLEARQLARDEAIPTLRFLLTHLDATRQERDAALAERDAAQGEVARLRDEAKKAYRLVGLMGTYIDSTGGMGEYIAFQDKWAPDLGSGAAAAAREGEGA